VGRNQNYLSTVLPLDYLNSPVYCYNFVRRDLNLMQISNVTICCIDGIMIISETEEQVMTHLN
jgi:hypothetical protein